MAQTATTVSDSQIKAAEAALAHLDPDEGTWPTGKQVEAIIAATTATTATAGTVAGANLRRYLDVIGVDLPLMPVFFDGAHSPNVFGCAECATIHMPSWDEQTLWADRYVPATDRRSGCDGCENLPVEHELPC